MPVKDRPNGSRYTIGSDGDVFAHPLDGASLRLGRVQVAWHLLTWLGPLRPIVHDLLHIATAIHHVDRLAPRTDRSSRMDGRETPRQIELEIGVAEPGQWNSVLDELKALLKWMTDDLWEVTFTRSAHTPPSQGDLRVEPLPDAAEVALFSGGLDSLAGAHARLREQGRSLYLLSSLGTSVRQRFLWRALAPLERSRYRWIGFHHRFSAFQQPLKMDTLNRTRGLLFFSAAAAVADALGVDFITTYECGVGALNLPMNGAQLGAQNTHAMHPSTLLRFERILSRVLEKKLRLDAPFFLHTKGELCRKAGADLMRLAESSNSCDETERNKRDLNDHCGVCTSCLLRRAALHSVLGEADPTRYRGHATRHNGRYEINAFNAQAERFTGFACYRDLVDYDHTVDSATEYLLDRTLPRPSSKEVESALLDLFKRHSAEVRSFYDRQLPGNLLERSRQAITKLTHDDLFSAAR